MGANEYECAMCHGVFKKGRTDEEARAEELDNFGVNDPDAEIVCDGCYQKMVAIKPPSGKGVR
jgi:hypothetical protein